MGSSAAPARRRFAGYYILFEGLIGYLDGAVREVKYSSLTPDKPVEYSSTGGWLGFTDKYWLTSLVPSQTEAIQTRFIHSLTAGVAHYQTDFLGPELTVAPGAKEAVSTQFFAGAKEFNLLETYSASGIPLFEYSIDFGWFWFLTKPIFRILQFFYQHLGNFGLAILLLTLCVKLLFFPLANKSYTAMSKMKLLQPEIQKLRERFPDDKARQQQEMMALYKRVGANPLAGCLPIVIQIPVFFSLYKVLFVTIEMRHAPFYGWIHDLSAPDPTSFANLFGLLPFTPPHFLMIGAWPLIMGLTMFLQQKLNPQPVDPVQARMFMACRSSSPTCCRRSRPGSSSIGPGTTCSASASNGRSCAAREPPEPGRADRAAFPGRSLSAAPDRRRRDRGGAADFRPLLPLRRRCGRPRGIARGEPARDRLSPGARTSASRASSTP